MRTNDKVFAMDREPKISQMYTAKMAQNVLSSRNFFQLQN